MCSRVLHFFDGESIEVILKKIRNWLVQGGELFIIVETPFLGNWTKFIPIYNNNKKNNAKWPGYAEVTTVFEDSGRASNLPEFMHFFDIDTMARVLSDCGFSVERISYIDRATTFPEDLLLDGRESLGVIAKKIEA
ncbi:MAG: hypothetical protein P1U63_11885 [Coxiellaceae bacterium]|nr:hypothetical protein [Coxiellaceae bacterium]